MQPPFFQGGILPTDLKRRLARHVEGLTYSKLLAFVSQNLAAQGSCSMVLPYGNEPEFLAAAREHGLFPQRVLHVRTRPNKSIHRSLIELGRGMIAPTLETLCIHNQASNAYSEAYQRLTGTFYLNESNRHP